MTVFNGLMQAELLASRRYCALRAELSPQQRVREDGERRNHEQAQGFLHECGCCFTETPLNRMVCCEGEPSHVSVEIARSGETR